MGVMWGVVVGGMRGCGCGGCWCCGTWCRGCVWGVMGVIVCVWFSLCGAAKCQEGYFRTPSPPQEGGSKNRSAGRFEGLLRERGNCTLFSNTLSCKGGSRSCARAYPPPCRAPLGLRTPGPFLGGPTRLAIRCLCNAATQPSRHSLLRLATVRSTAGVTHTAGHANYTRWWV